MDRRPVRRHRLGRDSGLQRTHADPPPAAAGAARRVLPLALLAFDALLIGSASPVWLAACVARQGLTSHYSLTLTLAALTAAWLVRADAWRRGQVRATVTRIAAAAALASSSWFPR